MVSCERWVQNDISIVLSWGRRPAKAGRLFCVFRQRNRVSDTMAAKGGADMLNILLELLKSFDERRLRIVYQFARRLQ